MTAHHQVPVRLRCLVQRRPHGEAAGDVGEDVDPPEPRDGGFGCRGSRLRRKEIRRQQHGVGIEPERAARVLEPARLPVHQGQAGALRSECCRHRGTEIAGRAGYQHHLSR